MLARQPFWRIGVTTHSWHCCTAGKYDDKYGKYDDKYGKYDDK
jgi:hypothetical protein